ncbi:hypothetical protein YC2023_078656 [Brassica napus]
MSYLPFKEPTATSTSLSPSLPKPQRYEETTGEEALLQRSFLRRQSLTHDVVHIEGVPRPETPPPPPLAPLKSVGHLQHDVFGEVSVPSQ